MAVSSVAIYDLTVEAAMDVYVNKHYTIAQACKHFGVADKTFRQFLQDNGIHIRSRTESQLLYAHKRQKHKLTKELLEDLYITKQMAGPEICKIHNISTAVLTKLFKRYNVPVRSVSENGLISSAASMSDRASKFLTDANVAHNSKYTYNNVKYVSAHIKVAITCPVHGDFYQKPYKHVQGTGCSECISCDYTTDTFIDRARFVHKGRYTYDKVQYVSTKIKVIITCLTHGDFEQLPTNHLSGRGCAKCSGNVPITTNEFVIKANKVHSMLYRYDSVVFKTMTVPVSIICRVHGVFLQTPIHHLNGGGCSKCKKLYRPTTQEYIDSVTVIHNNKYTYYKTAYKSSSIKITITCPVHGDFERTPAAHTQGAGCPRCVGSGYSQKAVLWLDGIAADQNIYIQHALNGGEYTIPKTRFRVDGYCAETNTVYEFHGDCWHGNPAVFKADELCHPYIPDVSARELYDATAARELAISEMGYNVVVIWEKEWDAK